LRKNIYVPDNFVKYIKSVYNQFPLKTITPYFDCLEKGAGPFWDKSGWAGTGEHVLTAQGVLMGDSGTRQN
jgi:hypothetical protein